MFLKTMNATSILHFIPKFFNCTVVNGNALAKSLVTKIRHSIEHHKSSKNKLKPSEHSIIGSLFGHYFGGRQRSITFLRK